MGWTLPGRPDILLRFTVDDAEDLIARTLLPDEREALVKTLELAFNEVYEDAVFAVTDKADFEDVGASSLAEQNVYREYGCDEWITIDKIDQHGDTVLVTAVNGDEYTHDIDEVVERWANNPVKSEEDA